MGSLMGIKPDVRKLFLSLASALGIAVITLIADWASARWVADSEQIYSPQLLSEIQKTGYASAGQVKRGRLLGIEWKKANNVLQPIALPRKK